MVSNRHAPATLAVVMAGVSFLSACVVAPPHRPHPVADAPAPTYAPPPPSYAPPRDEAVITVAPPPPRVEVPGDPPGPRRAWVWQPGHWHWRGYDHVWVPGHWARRIRPGAVWIAPHWDRHGNGWVYFDGHWQ